MGFIALATVISVLNTIAAGIRNGLELHDAQVAVAKLQIQYARHLHELMYGAEVDVVEDDEETAPDESQVAQTEAEAQAPQQTPPAAQAA